jgi:hypothetical protein
MKITVHEGSPVGSAEFEGGGYVQAEHDSGAIVKVPYWPYDDLSMREAATNRAKTFAMLEVKRDKTDA